MAVTQLSYSIKEGFFFLMSLTSWLSYKIPVSDKLCAVCERTARL